MRLLLEWRFFRWPRKETKFVVESDKLQVERFELDTENTELMFLGGGEPSRRLVRGGVVFEF